MATQAIPMYQGEEFGQQLSYFSDVDQTIPLVVAYPVMDLRDVDGGLVARFDTTGTELGLISITAPGVLVLSMAYEDTVLIPAGSYPLDIFADVGFGEDTRREAITKRGVLKLAVRARITQDAGP